ncbi:MAG: hypothetical protein IAE65_03230 [Ignavibacteria bacterium]|nr:hypothetical protein [Ignavibacteria bacterium]
MGSESERCEDKFKLFVCYARGLIEGRETQILGSEDLLRIFGNKTNNPNTGDIGFFTLSNDATFGDKNYSSSYPLYSALFIIINKANEPQFLNRINTNMPVLVSTSSQIFQYFIDLRNRNKEFFQNIPELSKEINYYENE